MKLRGKVPFRLASCALTLSLAARTLAISQQYCSSQNTGSNYSAVYSIYQSNGACFDTCEANYAFAIVQYQDCWCSNYIPAVQQNVSNCNEDCPGYPDDKCGNAAQGLYGYIPLSIQPSGTAGAASSTSAASSSIATSSSSQPVSTSSTSSLPTSASEPSTTIATHSVTSLFASTSTHHSVSSTSGPSLTPTLLQTSSQSPSQSYTQASSSGQSSDTSSSSPSTSSATSTSTPTLIPTTTSTSTTSSSVETARSSTSASTSTTAPAAGMIAATTQGPSAARTTSETPTPVTSVLVVTVAGAIVTQTVTSTPVPASGDDASGDLTAQRKGLSGGAIAGIVVGTLVGLAALSAFAFALWRRKKMYHDAEGAGPRSPRRTTSVLSRTGLLSRGRAPSMTERADAEEPLYTATGSNSVRHSMLFGAGATLEGVHPESPLGSSHDLGRHNRPLVYDQRLNPSALFAYREANGSRVSMQDQQDYSRPLGIVNPDPARPSFESSA